MLPSGTFQFTDGEKIKQIKYPKDKSRVSKGWGKEQSNVCVSALCATLAKVVREYLPDEEVTFEHGSE